MNIHDTEVPKEILGQVLDTERLASAPRHAQEKTRQAVAENVPGNNNPQEALSRESAQKLVREAGRYFHDQGVNLHFKLLEDSNAVQVEVVDAQSRKVIRKIPEDEVVKLSAALKRMAKGVLDRAV